MPAKRKSKKPIPEDFELSDDEPTTVNFNQEQKLTSKFRTFGCPLCSGKLQLRNEIEINPKGISCRCNPCSFKLTKNDKTMNVSKDDDGGITLDSSDHSIQFSFNRTMFNTRMEVLEKAIDKHIDRIDNYENKDLVEIHHIFYDEEL